MTRPLDDNALYVAQLRRFFDYCVDPVLCRAVLHKRATAQHRTFHFLNAWDRPRRSY